MSVLISTNFFQHWRPVINLSNMFLCLKWTCLLDHQLTFSIVWLSLCFFHLRLQKSLQPPSQLLHISIHRNNPQQTFFCREFNINEKMTFITVLWSCRSFHKISFYWSKQKIIFSDKVSGESEVWKGSASVSESGERSPKEVFEYKTEILSWSFTAHKCLR